jgi:hypothetical protein
MFTIKPRTNTVFRARSPSSSRYISFGIHPSLKPHQTPKHSNLGVLKQMYLNNGRLPFLQQNPSGRVQGGFLGIISRDPSVSKSNCYMLTSFDFFSLFRWRIFYKLPLKQSVNFLVSWTRTSYLSNSTSASLTCSQHSPVPEESRFLRTVDPYPYPRASKSNQVKVDIIQFFPSRSISQR